MTDIQIRDGHSSHCCIRHGCKYDNENCSVVLGILEQEYPCEACELDVTDSPLLPIIRALIDDNKLREKHGEDTAGVLIKCGAYKHVNVTILAREIDKNE